jgi:hypothetical protein
MNHRRESPPDAPATNEAIETIARRHVEQDQLYAFYFRDVTCHFEDGLLALEGRVGSFYLKEILQTKLGDIPGITKIDNRVDVVNPRGVSSVPKPRSPMTLAR